MNSFFIISAFLGVLYLLGGKIASHQLMVDRIIFEQAHLLKFEIAVLVSWFGAIFNQMLIAVSPFVIILLVVVVAANMSQTGPVFTFFPLKPDPKRLNPVEGFKRIFSAKLLFEAAKNLVKLGLFGVIIYFVITFFFSSWLSRYQSYNHNSNQN